MPTAAGADALTVALRARGMRVTPQRRDVLAAVQSLGRATAEQIAAQVSGIDLTTVYRTVQLLEDIGLVAHTHLGHGAPSYRSADDAHVHVICHSCGSVLDAPPKLTDDLARRLSTELGFTLDVAHFTVFGHCSNCIAAAAALPADPAATDEVPAAGAPVRREHQHARGA